MSRVHERLGLLHKGEKYSELCSKTTMQQQPKRGQRQTLSANAETLERCGRVYLVLMPDIESHTQARKTASARATNSPYILGVRVQR